MVQKIQEAEDLYHSGDLLGALRCLREAQALEPDHPEVLNDLGVVSLSLGRMVDALVYFQRALNASPEHAEAKENLKDCLLGRAAILPPDVKPFVPWPREDNCQPINPFLMEKLELGRPWRFSILAYSDVEPNPERRLRWGDHWFKERLARALRGLGHEIVEKAPDILVHLFGVPLRSLPRNTVNILWIHSHPDLVRKEDVARYHGVFCLSPFFAEKISRWGIPVRVLLGATDFKPILHAPLEHDVVFVGNAKGPQGRKIIRDLGDIRSLPFALEVWGEGWQGLLPRGCWKGLYYPNDELDGLYAASGVVLNDHHEDMRREGFLNPRVLDILAAGGKCVSDSNPIIPIALGNSVATYDRSRDLIKTILSILVSRKEPQEDKKSTPSLKATEFSFEESAKAIVMYVSEVLTEYKRIASHVEKNRSHCLEGRSMDKEDRNDAKKLEILHVPEVTKPPKVEIDGDECIGSRNKIKPLDFTGERVVPGKTPARIWNDHVGRYEFAKRLLQGSQTVLDIACGTGYGTSILADACGLCIGVDIDIDSVSYARERYGRSNVVFIVGDIVNIPLRRKFDVVVCFETIEHVSDPVKAMCEITELIDENGMLIVSSPNRYVTSPGRSSGDRPCNPFHTREFSRSELSGLLSRYFSQVEWYGQHPCARAMPIKETSQRVADPNWENHSVHGFHPVHLKAGEEARYFVCVCREKRPL